MLKLAVFDMDGLMFDTEGVTARAYVEMGQIRNVPTTRDQFLGYLGMNADDIKKVYYELFGKDFDADGFYRAVGDHRSNILAREGVPVKKGLAELTDALDALGIPMVVASGSEEDVIRRNLEMTGFAGRFKETVCTRSVGRGKPFPDVYLYICEKWNVKPEETLVLEDSENGIRAGLAAGTKVIAVPDLVPVDEKLAAACYALVPDLEKVRELLPALMEEKG